MFVAGLPDTITEDVLRQLFEATGGTVVEVSIPRDRANGPTARFGFVTLSTSEEGSLCKGLARRLVPGRQDHLGAPVSARTPEARGWPRGTALRGTALFWASRRVWRAFCRPLLQHLTAPYTSGTSPTTAPRRKSRR